MTPTDTLREAVRAAIRAAFEDETNGKPVGNIINIGCEGASYLKPDDAANEFLASATDAALSAIEAAGWRIVPANMFDRISNDVAEMPNSADEVTPVTFRTAFEIERDRLGSKAAAPRLDATVRGEEG